MMMWVLTFVILCLCFCVFMQTYWIWHINQARRRRGAFKKENLTMFDVRRLIIEGEIETATVIYAEIFKVSSKEAKKAVKDLERNIQKKHFEIE